MKQNRKKSWLKSKGYIHLTNRLNVRENKNEIYRLVKNPSKVSKHAFFPLLNKTIPQRRYKIIDHDKDYRPIRAHKSIEKGKVKSTKKNRPIHYATHIDALIYAYYSDEILKKVYEEKLKTLPNLSNSIIAYRRIEDEKTKTGKNNIHFAKEVFDFIKNQESCVALAFDIKSFFTSLNHRHLKKSWCRLLGAQALPTDHYNIYKSITRFSYIKRDDFRVKNKSFDEGKLAKNREKGIHAFFESPLELRKEINEGRISIYKNQFHDEEGNLCGIPQGLAISAMLANIYLLDFDKSVCKEVSKKGGLYRRYSDDIAIICQQRDREEITGLVSAELKKYKLKISKAKTEICEFSRNKKGVLQTVVIKNIKNSIIRKKGLAFSYLGFEFNGKSILIKSKNLSKFYRRMKYAVKGKARRIRKVREKNIPGETVLYRRKLYRSYTSYGCKKRTIKKRVFNLCYNGTLRKYQFKGKDIKKKHWGNFIGYADRASKIMNEPKIKYQTRNHKKILKKAIEMAIKK